MKHNGQIAIEFLLLIAIAFGVILTFLVAILSVSEGNTKMKAYQEMDDLGKSLQQEFLLAAQLEDGYTRRINLPLTANGERYTAYLGITNNTNITHGYVLLTYESTELFYLIPPVTGNITLGNNVLVKNNGTLRIN
jgi:hypothetical protein